MSILRRWLGTEPEDQSTDAAATASVRKIVARLEALAPERARFIAAFAYILGRVAFADLDISDDESRAMEALVRERGGLPEDQALLVVEIAKSQNRLFGGTENFLVTREFSEIATAEEKIELLDCLFAVSAADDAISVVEEEQVRKVASELGLSHQQYVETRARYSTQREVMKGFHRHAAAPPEEA